MSWFLSLSLFYQLILVYGVLINIGTFFFFGWDKLRSRIHRATRVSEKTLWFWAAIGGSIGGIIGMSFFRHKTKKISFQAGMAIILSLHISILLYLLSA